MKKIIYLLLILSLSVSCSSKTKTFVVDSSKPHLKIIFSFDSSSYPWLMGTKYPQMAVWIKEKKSGTTKTIFVTKSAAEKKWFGSKERPSSVPVWYGISKNQKFKIDALTGATPSGSSYEIKWQIPDNLLNRNLEVFIEANISFDYNAFYKKDAPKNSPAFNDVNGQPSIIWKGRLNTGNKNISLKPDIIGHGHVLGKNHTIDKNLSNVTTAVKLFHYIKIIYMKGK